MQVLERELIKMNRNIHGRSRIDEALFIKEKNVGKMCRILEEADRGPIWLQHPNVLKGLTIVGFVKTYRTTVWYNF